MSGEYKFDFGFEDAMRRTIEAFEDDRARAADKQLARSELKTQLSFFMAHNSNVPLTFDFEDFSAKFQAGSGENRRNAILEIIDADSYRFTRVEGGYGPVMLKREQVAEALLFFAYNRKPS